MKIWYKLVISPTFELINTTPNKKVVSFATKSEEKNTKQVRIRCPICGWQPDGKPYWGCEKCHTQAFDTFKTHAHCPNPECGNSWTFTQCIACHERSPHEDWYVEIDE
jgi:hypothetical protein